MATKTKEPKPVVPVVPRVEQLEVTTPAPREDDPLAVLPESPQPYATEQEKQEALRVHNLYIEDWKRQVMGVGTSSG